MLMSNDFYQMHSDLMNELTALKSSFFELTQEKKRSEAQKLYANGVVNGISMSIDKIQKIFFDYSGKVDDDDSDND